ncbi:Transcriptional regulator containing PAS, AAA-type ATPase, and DNA-binding Fis domains [Dethiosulfatibacter aminovorans DSM 17477]|uniref:Transcriptional regulator containing PAS, AAA-type ATPase, and DNA-binding Fis domains n=1 Tax=Dethiosulfatibacter aminovorans DSM 17477 TaxID=1121476 RepID=A0A1M6EJT3_9FIRM|nr:sigma 54-interacting transcriptional regulator [Dethiosulfatibacter aminovorans]SHI85717.1 Transcriptional regulator containing PAS, AAA-type ATPase, and DNA-binding Fis domains [Dethiosulfatibacter aminovorans DSM 17477]
MEFFQILDILTNAVIMVDHEGYAMHVNSSAKRLLKSVGKSDIGHISEIDPDFAEMDYEDNNIRKSLFFRNLSISVSIIRKRDIFNGILYIFEETPSTSAIIGTILDCVDDVVGIVNKEGIYEKCNIMAEKILGICEKDYVGRDFEEFEKRELQSVPIVGEVLKKEKKIQKNVEYLNGRSITYTGIPIFNDSGELTRMVVTGRDVSDLVRLKGELKQAQDMEIEYYTELQELKEQRRHKKREEEVIHSSLSMEKLLNIAKRAANTDSSVFITGESGVGKEVIAKHIHKNSDRKDKAFIAINCAAIPSELLESEFFGYEEGAFTGAKKGGKKGLFEEANGGTIFLDEIGELPLSMQSKLLRVIQENGFMRIGGNKIIPVDVRYISATNIAREDLASKEKFRQDLYYRLSVVPLRIPPLRDRKSDIFPLAYHFLKLNNAKYDRDVKITSDVMEKFHIYSWPGNVRELKNVIERMVILSSRDVVSIDDLDNLIQLDTYDDSRKNGIISINGLIELNKAYRMVDEIMISSAIDQFGTIAEAAKQLGIAPSTIHRKVSKGYNFNI